MLDYYRNKYSEILGVPFENIIISCTHSHSTFESIGLLGTGIVPGIIKSRLNTRVINEMMKKILIAMKDAKKPQNLSKVKIGFKKISVGQIAKNRRKPNEEIDPKIMVVKFVDYNDETKLKALFVNIGVHCTILGHKNTLLSGDWAGSLRRILILKLKKRNVSCVGVFQGAEGDVNPRFLVKDWHSELKNKILSGDYPPLDGQYQIFPEVESYALYLAEQINYVVDKISCEEVNQFVNLCIPLKISTKNIAVNSKLKSVLWYIFNQLYKHVLIGLFKLVNSKILGFMNIKEGYHHSYAHVLRIGDLKIVLSPGEMFYDYGERLMNYDGEKSHESTIIFGLANDYSSYLYSVSEYVKGGYENVFQIAPKAGPYIVGHLLRLLNKIE